MKKLLLAITIWASGLAAANAQAGYDLEFFSFKLEESGLQKDTAFIGCTYDLKGGIRNNGPNGFPGFNDLILNVYVHNDTSGIDHANLVPDFTLSAFDLPAIAANSSMNISRPIFISDDYFQADTGNIIIVWPSDTYQDDNQENNYSRINAFVPADTTQCGTAVMQETAGQLSFGMYPNPAADQLNLTFGRLSTEGTVTISDMMGHIVYTTRVFKGALELTIPLSGNLANGLYFVSVRAGGNTGVSKLQVQR